MKSPEALLQGFSRSYPIQSADSLKKNGIYLIRDKDMGKDIETIIQPVDGVFRHLNWRLVSDKVSSGLKRF